MGEAWLATVVVGLPRLLARRLAALDTMDGGAAAIGKVRLRGSVEAAQPYVFSIYGVVVVPLSVCSLSCCPLVQSTGGTVHRLLC
jgi:hypothetical protein